MKLGELLYVLVNDMEDSAFNCIIEGSTTWGLLKEYRILLFFLMMAIWSSCTHDYKYTLSKDYYKSKDIPTWTVRQFDPGDQIFWAKRNLTITERLPPFEPLGLKINFFGDYELFWDNTLIGKNGTPGKEDQDKKTSQVDRVFLVPDSLAGLGEHEIKIKASRQLIPDTDRSYNTILGPYNELIAVPLKQSAIASLLAGTFLLGGIYFLVLFLSKRSSYQTLLFSLSCFLFFLLVLLEYIKFYIPIHYTLFNTRLEVVSLITFFVAVTIPLFFALQFRLPMKKFFLAAYFFILIVAYIVPFGSYDFSARLLAVLMWSFLILVSLFGMRGEATGAKVIFFALICAALVDYFLLFDLSLFLGFMFILLAMFYILLEQMKEQQKIFEFSLVQSERLRNELLKKKIQPHFLLNTLTSLIDWIEEVPEKGVRMIEALADEFTLFNKIERETLIPLRAEIDLCRSHLEVMRFRKEVNYEWEEEIQNDQVKIPPAILHTLLENGITHCRPGKDNSLKFRLQCRNSSKEINIDFLAFGELRKKNNTTMDGTGIKYVKARLTESFGNTWEFSSESTNHGWKNQIRIWNYEDTNR